MHIITSGSGFTGTGGPVINFATLPSFTFDTSASSGFVTGTAVLDSTNETALFNNGLYINIHTALNGGGEIRGNLVNATAVPEPATWAMLAGVAALAGAVWQRRRSRLG